MSLKGSNNTEKIWNFLKTKELTEYGIAGLMGNLKAESGLNPINVENKYEHSLGFTDATYTKAVDNGTYNNFVKDKAGYGLAQWTYWNRKQNLLNFAKSKGVSVGDLEMQLEFLYKELSTSYGSVLKVLKTANSVRIASDAVLLQFERPADQSEVARKKRASYGQIYYDQFANNKAVVSKPNNNSSIITETSKPVSKDYELRVVKSGDTLYKYAKEIFGNSNRYPEIMKLNNMTTTIIVVGDTIKLPKINTKINKGDKVKVINAISYEGKPFKLFHKQYDVIQVNNDRVVIGIGKIITSSINIKNIQKI